MKGAVPSSDQGGRGNLSSSDGLLVRMGAVIQPAPISATRMKTTSTVASFIEKYVSTSVRILNGLLPQFDDHPCQHQDHERAHDGQDDHRHDGWINRRSILKGTCDGAHCRFIY